jgi:phosphatidylglycerol---prolipoprotein diacylglyceryl transferase
VSHLLIYPEFNPIAFEIGPIQVRWYGLMYLLGFLAGWLGARYRATRPGSPLAPVQIDDLVFYTAFGVIVGGRVGYMFLYNLEGLIANPLSLLAVWQGGMSFHGGLLGVLVALWLFSRKVRKPFFVITDFLAPWATPGLFFGRVGNFINGELWGRQTDPEAPWAVIVDGVARHPSQLYEAFLEGIVMFVVLFVYSAKPRPTMAVSGLFLLLYGVFRFAVEFVRLPDAEIGYIAFGWLTQGQLLSMPMIVLGALFLVIAYRRRAGLPAAGDGGAVHSEESR